MLDKKLGRDAAQIAYDDTLKVNDTIKGTDYPSLNGYTVKEVFTEENKGGLTAYALENGKGDIVIAFKGSLEGQDWKDDVANLGWRQWEEARPNINKYLEANWRSGEELTFAGHSLGGALAQYATYETALNHDSQRGDMNLLTISGLGSKNGIEDNLGGYDPTVVAGVEADNIFHNEDPVPRLGGGHIGETHSIGSGGPGNDGVYGAHKATNYTDDALAGATTKSPDYYKNAAVQNKNPGVYEPLAELMFRLAVDGEDAFDDYGWEELVEVVKLVPKLDEEIKETQRLVGDFVEGIGADISREAGAVKDSVVNKVMEIKDDLTDMANRGLETAEMALKHGWDTAGETWDEFTDWTKKKTNEVTNAIDDAKNKALDWFDDRADAFDKWFDDAVDGTTDWLSDKSDQIGELYDWVTDQGTRFSDGVKQKWEDFKESARETADNTIDWLKEKSSEIYDYGKQKFDEGRTWLSDTYDDLKNTFKDKSSELADWAGEKLDDLGKTKDRIKDGIEGLLDDLSDWWNGNDEDPDDYAEDVRDRSTTARTEASPLVLDLDGDGLELSSVTSKGAVWWDIDTDGMRERSGWVRPDDGLLAIDSNANGEIDDHSELFGTQTVDGFTNLAVLDSNSDGVIDDKDEAFADLVVWRDLDQDGQSDPGELQSLTDAGVRSIKLAATLGNTEVAGNRVTHVSSYTGTDGKTREISDVWFTYDNLNSISGSTPGFDPDAYTLPQLRGYGALADLRSAMAEDARLEKMVGAVAALNARNVFSPDEDILNRMQDILFRWAGVSEIDPTSRGPYVDARQIAFVEAFTDRPFLQHGRPNPAPEGGRTMTNAFETALFEMYARVLVQTVGPQLFLGNPQYRWQTDDFAAPLRIDFDALGKLARSYRDAGADMNHVWTELIRLLDTTVDVESLSKKQARKLDNLVEATENGSGITVDKALTKIYPVVGLGLNGTSGDDDLRGGGGSDSLDTGAGNDTLTGLRGDDRMNGGDGNDTLNGGPGNDTMNGGTGDDTYIYSSGFDTIVEGGGDDRLIIDASLDLSDLAFVKSLANDLDLEIYAEGELIVRIEGFYAAGGNGAVETLQLKDGTIFDLVRQSKGIVGTNKRDVLKGDASEFILSDRIVGLAGNDVLKGLKGADVLEGDAGNDKLLGGAGDDIQIGGDGNDKLIGGAGNDVSQGGMGNDMYMVSGKETIVEEGGTDIVVMRKRLAPDDVTLYRTTLSNDLTIESGKDRILVQNHFLDGKGIEKIRFRYEGKTETVNVTDMAVEIRGTDANDYMRGDNGGVPLRDVLRGLGGIDRLYGYAGDDRLDGGDDNDYLYGGDGDDTLLGGKGDDFSYGGAGGDTYIAGPGNDFVQDYSAETDKNDMIVLPSNVSKADLSLFRMLDGDLLLSWTGGSMRVDRAYDSRYVIEKLRYGDGKTVNLTAQAVETLGTESADTIYGNSEEFGSRNDTLRGLAGDDRLYGYDGNDLLDGGADDDQMFGAEGRDTYRAGVGHDYISDVGASDLSDGRDMLKLAAGILPAKVSYTRQIDGDLVIGWKGGSVRIDNAFDQRYAVEDLMFANGARVDLTALELETVGTNGDDSISGNREEHGSRNDTLRGLDGRDYLYGYDGNDTLDGGDGDDNMYGAEGRDTYLAGLGNDFISDVAASDLTDGKDVLRLAAGIGPGAVTYTRLTDGDLLIDWTGGSVRIDNAFDQRYAVETLRFANGTTVDLTTLAATTKGTNGSETIYGNREEFGSRDDTILGLDGNDNLYGYDGDDTLDGGAGNDNMYGAEGADTYHVGEGDDYISDFGAADLTDAKDVIRLAGGILPGDVTYSRLPDGDLLIDWGTGSVRVDNAFDARYAVETLRFANGATVDLTMLAADTVGTNAGESLSGNREEFGSRDDTILGLDGNDTLYGYDGDDTLDGGAGNDTMYGAEGADTYHAGEGDDYISDVGAADLTDGKDVLRLAAGIGPGAVSYTRLTDGDLLIDWTTGSVRIDNAFDQRYAVETLRFANGTTVDLTTLAATTKGTNGSETIYGNREEFGSRDDTILGLDGNDNLYGYDGDDTLDGGAGNDNMYGAEGADTYHAGEGDDYISDVGAADLTDGDDVIMLAAGIQLGDVSFARRSDGDLLISWGTGSVLIDYAFDQRYAVEMLKFAGGGTIDLTTLAVETLGSAADDTLYGNTEELGSRDDTIRGLGGNDRLYGYDGNDTLDGGEGDDSMYGAQGADTYLVGKGDDYVYDAGLAGDGDDRLLFDAGIEASDLSFFLVDNSDLRISWTGGSVLVDNWTGSTSKVEKAELADGTVIDLSAQTLTPVTTPTNQTLTGDAADNTLDGGDGNDRLYGYDGKDTLTGNKGDDSYYGANGADIYVVGEGDDYIQDTGLAADGNDLIRLPNSVQVSDVSVFRLSGGDMVLSWTGGSVRIYNGLDERYAVENVRFGNGVVAAIAGLAFETVGTGNAETIYGNREELGSRNDVIRGLDGNDTLYGYDGDDTLDGGAGNDTMYGADGGDTYLVGPGHDFIQDYALADLSDGDDMIRLAAGIAPGNVTYTRQTDGDLVIDWGFGSVRIDRAFDARYTVEKLRFNNGTTVDLTALSPETHGTGAAESIYGNTEENGGRDDTLRGFDGDDRLYGYDGDDTLDGGEGDDEMYGADGGDTYLVGPGHDFISDVGAADLSDGDDMIRLAAGIKPGDVTYTRQTDGDLVIDWGFGSVRIDRAFDARYTIEKLRFNNGTTVDLAALSPETHGTGAAETLYGNTEENGGRDDVLRGFDGNDTLYGYDGDDILDGGDGNDTMYGADGGDVYLVGPGNDTISDYGLADLSDGDDMIRLAAGIKPGDVTYTRLTDGDLVIDWGFGSVRIDRAFDARYTVETLKFNNGTTVDLTTLSPETHGTGAAESVYGNTEENGGRDDTLRGFDGNDTLYGYDGDDILDGGEGDDTMYGADGGDVYLVGPGNDFISDYGLADLSDGKDVIRLAAGIKPGDVSFLRMLDGDLLIGWDAGSVRINVAFDARYAVETLRFKNGTTVDLTKLAVETHGTGGNDTLFGNQEEFGSRDDVLLGMDGNDTLYGYDGDDELNGGLGDDRLYGYTGDDTYVVSRGNDIFDDGRSGSTDTILFKTVASADDLTMTRTGSYDLQILWSGGEVILRNHFYSDDYAFERIVFSNGTSMELDI